MASEWIPVDICLGSKPEVQELIDLTGEPLEVVGWRLFQLWGWAALNTADGTARATPGRLARICGGSEAFWKAVASVGWLAFDAEAGTATIPGWGRRFSMAAKARACHVDRQKRWRGAKEAHARLASASTGEEKTDSSSSARRCAVKPGKAATGPAPAGWDALRDAWNASLREGDPLRWRSPKPPKGAADCLAEDGWLERAMSAIGRLPSCRFFVEPVPLSQLCIPGFVDRVLGGQYDKPKPARARSGPDDRPPPAAWTGEDAEALERTKRMWAEKLKAVEEGAA